MLLVPFIDVPDINTPALVIESMQNVQENAIACVNWPENYPSHPDVSFKIAHNGDYLFLYFFVEENEILAETTKDNGPVWTDSCVEFFVSFDNLSSYYNAEFSCIGKMLFGYKYENSRTVYGDSIIMSQIGRYSSLGTESFSKKQGDFRWNLLVIIPVAAYWKSGLQSFNGMKARANFYKCGDNLTTPHFLSWKPIQTEKPNFHVPEFFGELYFEEK